MEQISIGYIFWLVTMQMDTDSPINPFTDNGKSIHFNDDTTRGAYASHRHREHIA